MLEAIVADCYGRWGGRFSLIVPCETGEIRPAYLPWIEAYDPDIIYSYIDLADSVIEKLHDQFYPSFLVKHEFYKGVERDAYAFRPQLPLSPLNSLSVSVMAARGGAFAGPKPVTLVDVHRRGPSPQFLQENFGCYSQTLSPWPIPPDMTDYVRAFTLVEQEIVDNPHIQPRPQSEFVTDYKVILDRLAKQRDVYGLAMLSAWLCPRLEMRDPRWANKVNLVVGDSFADRIIFWNARSHLAVHLDHDLVTLKVSRDGIDDTDTFAAIIGIIKNRIHVSEGNSNNSHITLRSAKSFSAGA